MRTNSSDIFNDNNHRLIRDLLNEVSNKHVLIMGDFNYANIDWTRHLPLPTAGPECRNFLECVDDNFYTQHVIGPTRNNSTLDLNGTKP